MAPGARPSGWAHREGRPALHGRPWHARGVAGVDWVALRPDRPGHRAARTRPGALRRRAWDRSLCRVQRLGRASHRGLSREARTGRALDTMPQATRARLEPPSGVRLTQVLVG